VSGSSPPRRLADPLLRSDPARHAQATLTMMLIMQPSSCYARAGLKELAVDVRQISREMASSGGHRACRCHASADDIAEVNSRGSAMRVRSVTTRTRYAGNWNCHRWHLQFPGVGTPIARGGNSRCHLATGIPISLFLSPGETHERGSNRPPTSIPPHPRPPEPFGIQHLCGAWIADHELVQAIDWLRMGDSITKSQVASRRTKKSFGGGRCPRPAARTAL